MVGALSHTPVKTKQNSHEHFSSAFLEFPPFFLPKRVYDPNFATILGDFNFDILLTLLDGFHF